MFAHSEGEGKGCTFTVDIPATVHESPVVIVNESRTVNRNCVRMNSRNRIKSAINDNHHIIVRVLKRILVVDDAAICRRMLCRSLKSSFVTVEAEDGTDAVEKVRISMAGNAGSFYNVILMDYQMPKMNGPAAVKAIRSLGFKGVIIGVTGNVLTEDVETFLSHGADVVLPKPVDVEELLRTISSK